MTAVNTFGANGLLARHTAVGSVFYTFDQQGSTAQRLDGAGNVISAHGFDAFGASLTANAAPADPYAGFGAQWGYRADAETGLLLLGQRYYDPASGRFVNRDPAGYGGGINLYAYCENDPVGWVDPAGKCIGSPGLGWGPSGPGSDLVKRIRNWWKRIRGGDDDDHPRGPGGKKIWLPGMERYHDGVHDYDMPENGEWELPTIQRFQLSCPISSDEAARSGMASTGGMITIIIIIVLLPIGA